MRKYLWALALCASAGIAVPGWAQERSKSLFGLGRSSKQSEAPAEKAAKPSKLKNYSELFGKDEASGRVTSGDAPSPAVVQKMMDDAERSRPAAESSKSSGSFSPRSSEVTSLSSGSKSPSSKKVSLADEFDDLDLIEQEEEQEEALEELAEDTPVVEKKSLVSDEPDSEDFDVKPHREVRTPAKAKAPLPRIDLYEEELGDADTGKPAWASSDSSDVATPSATRKPLVAEDAAQEETVTPGIRQTRSDVVNKSRHSSDLTTETPPKSAVRSLNSKLDTPIDIDEEYAAPASTAQAPRVPTSEPSTPAPKSNRLTISRSPNRNVTPVSASSNSLPLVTSGNLSSMTPSATSVVSQSPTVNVEWRPTGAVTVGQESSCELVVKNTGTVVAQKVEIEATFPSHVRLISSDPKPDSNSKLIWQFDEIGAGDKKVIQVKFIPVERGEVAAAASVRFTGAAATSFAVTEPLLTLKLEGPSEVMVGENASQTLVISNPGTGTAANVKVEAIIPSGLEHSRGDRLTMELGNLAPGENRPIRLALTAVGGGRQIIEVHSTADNGLVQSAAAEVSVIAPSLASSIEGPGLRYLNRHATYTLHVSNDGAAATDSVRVMHKVPDGFEFISADKGILYDPQNRMLNWFVGRLDRGEKAQASVVLNAKTTGEYIHYVRATSEHGAISDSEITTRIEGAASLVVDVSDIDDPVEVGVESAYEIRVKNEGTAPATNVALSCEMPAGMEFLSASGDSSHAQSGEQIVFQPVSEVGAGQTLTYRVKFKGTLSGNIRFRTKLSSDSLQEPLASEEMTKVYGE